MKLLRLALAIAPLALLASTSHAQLFNVTLNGPSEAPPNASLGTGIGTVAFDPIAHTMTLNITFSGLTGNVTNSHIHAATAAAFTGTAGVATTTPTFAGFPSGVTSGSYSNTLNMAAAGSYNPAYITANGGTVATAEAALIQAAKDGKAYWNIHSTFAPGGEIRGFLVAAAPEPGTIALALLGLGVLGYRRKRA